MFQYAAAFSLWFRPLIVLSVLVIQTVSSYLTGLFYDSKKICNTRERRLSFSTDRVDLRRISLCAVGKTLGFFLYPTRCQVTVFQTPNFQQMDGEPDNRSLYHWKARYFATYVYMGTGHCCIVIAMSCH
jgi:hypothetical protein